jgi:hypothetical protein
MTLKTTDYIDSVWDKVQSIASKIFESNTLGLQAKHAVFSILHYGDETDIDINIVEDAVKLTITHPKIHIFIQELSKIWIPRNKVSDYRWHTVAACYTDKSLTNIHYSCHNTVNNNKRERDGTKCGDHNSQLDLPCRCDIDNHVFITGGNDVLISEGICILP